MKIFSLRISRGEGGVPGASSIGAAGSQEFSLEEEGGGQWQNIQNAPVPSPCSFLSPLLHMHLSGVFFHPPWCNCWCFKSLILLENPSSSSSVSLLIPPSLIPSYSSSLSLPIPSPLSLNQPKFVSAMAHLGNCTCLALGLIFGQLMHSCHPKFKRGRTTVRNSSQGEAVTPSPCSRAALVIPAPVPACGSLITLHT